MLLHPAMVGSSLLLVAPCAWALAVHDAQSAEGGVSQAVRGWSKDGQLLQAIDKWRKLGDDVCVTVDGHFMGGLSNTVGFINTALELAMQFGSRFVMPEIAPPRHELGNSFRHLFGKHAFCGAKVRCGTQCNLTRPNSSFGSHIWMGQRPNCFPEQLDVSCKHGRGPAKETCRCDRIVTLLTEHMIVHYDYSWTHRWLREAYWQSDAKKHHPPQLRRGHFDVVMHVRLGDVKGGSVPNIEWAKYFPPASYQGLLSAMTKVLPAKCFHLTLVTDGTGSDSDIKTIAESARELNIPRVQVHDRETSARAAFKRMTRADVLLCGGSGFSRLAAVLLPEDRPRVCIKSESHPLGYVGNTTELQLRGTGNDTTMPKAVSLLRKNVALRSLAATCEGALKT